MTLRNTILPCFSCFLVASYGAAQSSEWIGPDGRWSEAASWSPAGVPDSPNTDVVIVGNPTSVTVTLDGNRTIGDALIGNKDTLAIGPFRTLEVAGTTVDNDGFLYLSGVSGLNATLEIGSPNLLFTGTGTTSTSDTLSNRIVAGTAGNQITIGPDYTFRGAGYLGNSSGLGITNEGLIEATEFDAGLTISPGLNANISGEVDLINTSTGVIRSTGTGGLTLMGGNWQNQGLIEADQGGDIHLSNIFLDNHSGVLRQVVATSAFDIGDDTIIRGGTIKGRIDVRGNNVVLSDISIEAGLENNNSIVSINGLSTSLLKGSVQFIAVGDSNATLAVGGGSNEYNDLGIDEEGVVFTGPGTLHLDQAFARVVNAAGPSIPTTVTFGPSSTLHGGRGEFGANDNLGVISRGHVRTAGVSDFVINPGRGADVEGTVDFLNEGTLSANGSLAVMSLRNGTYRNDGVVSAQGGTIVFEATADLANQVGGQLNGGVWEAAASGVLELNGPTVFEIDSDTEVSISGVVSDIISGGQSVAETVNVNRGTLRLLDGKDATITSELTNYGHLELGEGSDYSAEVNSVALTLMDGALLTVGIAGTDDEAYGQIDVTGPASLAGDLMVSTLSEYVPTLGDTFTVISAAGGVSGAFDALIQPADLPAGLTFELSYLGNLVELSVVEASLLIGDYNGDGFVSQADLDLVLLNWGDTVLPAGFDETALSGGASFDGLVSQNELDGVLLNWGNGTPPSVSAVPEPASAGLMFAGMLCVARRRR